MAKNLGQNSRYRWHCPPRTSWRTCAGRRWGVQLHSGAMPSISGKGIECPDARKAPRSPTNTRSRFQGWAGVKVFGQCLTGRKGQWHRPFLVAFRPGERQDCRIARSSSRPVVPGFTRSETLAPVKRSMWKIAEARRSPRNSTSRSNRRTASRGRPFGASCWRRSSLTWRAGFDGKWAFLHQVVEEPCGIITRQRVDARHGLLLVPMEVVAGNPRCRGR